MNSKNMTIFFFATIGFILCLQTVPSDAQAAAWPATSYSPYFLNLFAHASSPVAAMPSGPGAQAPSIPIAGAGAAPGFAPAGFGPAAAPPGK
ncbi:hypothetical protein M3Y96_00672800 [Aphelenchoides besseyi]|nr:hypothetical protein M3Y96_00672800 [Aphelenchoides besseyi]